MGTESTPASPTGSGSPTGSASPTPRQILAVLLTVLAVVFVLQNTERVSLTLLFFDVVLPLWVATVSLLAIGVAIGWLISSRRARGRAR